MFKQPSLFLHPSIPKKLVHISGLIFVLPMLFLSRWEQIGLFSMIILLAWLLFHFIGYGLIGVCLLLLFFDYRIAVAAWLTLIVGDGVAGIFGLFWGSNNTLPWNKKKSVVGLVAFISGTILSLTLFYSLIIRVSVSHSIVIAVIIALVSSFVESLPFRINDNLTIVLVSGTLAALCVSILQ